MGVENYKWPSRTLSRIPFGIFTDPEVYRLEQEKIFQGQTWSYLCLEAEIPKEGDFKTVFVGEVPVVVNRANDGTLLSLIHI